MVTESMRALNRTSVVFLCVLLFATQGAKGDQAQLIFLSARTVIGQSPWQLFEYRTDGGIPVQLTNHQTDSRSTAVSPNGRRLSYVTSDGALWVLDRDGPEYKLAAPFKTGRYGFPSWIDNDKLAYSIYYVTPPTEDSDIYVYSFAEKRQRRLVAHTGSQDYVNASYSGDRIAYMSSVTTQLAGFGATITQQLWVASLKTGAVEQVTTGIARDTHPAWSPDGRQIAFTSDRSGAPHIWLIDLATKALTQVTTGSATDANPSWSPDGREILFLSELAGRTELRVVDVSTRKVSVLKPFGSRNVEIRDPVWAR